MNNFIINAVEAALTYGPIGAILLLGLFLIIRNTVPSYLSEKGKNLATKEDIQEITNKVEEVKTSHQLLIQHTDREQQTKLKVYLESASAIINIQKLIMSFSDISTPLKDISSSYANNNSTLSKIQVLGKDNTLEALRLFNWTVYKAFMDLTADRIVLENNNLRIENLLKNGQFNEHKKLSNEYFKDLIDIIEKSQDHSQKITLQIPKLIISIREELSLLDIDVDDFKVKFESDIENSMTLFDEFIRKMVKLYGII